MKIDKATLSAIAEVMKEERSRNDKEIARLERRIKSLESLLSKGIVRHPLADPRDKRYN